MEYPTSCERLVFLCEQGLKVINRFKRGKGRDSFVSMGERAREGTADKRFVVVDSDVEGEESLPSEHVVNVLREGKGRREGDRTVFGDVISYTCKIEELGRFLFFERRKVGIQKSEGARFLRMWVR